MSLRVDWNAFLLLALLTVVGFLLARRRARFESPRFIFSATEWLSPGRTSASKTLLLFPRFCLWLALLFCSLAFINPHKVIQEVYAQKPVEPHEGIAFYLVIDTSSSMAKEVSVVEPSGRQKTLSKLNWVKEVSQNFVKARPHDLIGLVKFARAAEVVVPLSLDHRFLSEKLASVEPVKYEEQDGTAIGYALYKTSTLIEAMKRFTEARRSTFQIKSAVIVLLTDGFQWPSPLDPVDSLRHIGLEEATAVAKKEGVRIYIINVEPQLSEAIFANQREALEKTAQQTQGKLFLIQNMGELSTVYSSINRLEKSLFLPPSHPKILFERTLSYASFFLWPGLFFFSLFLFLELWGLRRVP